MRRPKAEVIKRLAELIDGDEWETGDLLVEAFPPDEYGELGDKTNTGLYRELQDYAWELEREHGIELKVSTMRIYRATALAWPDDTRVSSAPFIVHRLLLGDDRLQRMERYRKKAKGQPLTRRAVARYRAEDRPKRQAVPWEAQVARTIEAAAKRALLEGIVTKQPDWWNAEGITEAQREVVIAALRDLATRMRRTSAA